MPDPDPPPGYSVPDLPDEFGYSIPDLPNDTGPAVAVEAQPAVAVQAPIDAPVQAPPAQEQGRFQMKQLDEEYQKGEKNTAAKTVKIDGQDVEIREKEWIRSQMNAARAKSGQGPVSEESWQKNMATTQYMNDGQRAAHQVGFQQDTDANKVQNQRIDPAILEQALKGQDQRIADLKESIKEKQGKPGQERNIRDAKAEIAHIESMKAKGQVDAIFVMDAQGQVYAKGASASLAEKEDATGRKANVHHSSFLAGEAVAGAGELVMDQQGFVKEITDRSGHYKPGEAQTTQTLNELERQGVDLNNTKFTMDHGKRITGMAKEYMQGGEKTMEARHEVTDEIKKRGKSVREALDSEAEKRSKRVDRLQGYLEQSSAGEISYEKLSKAAGKHADKYADEAGAEVKGGVKKQLAEQKKDLAKLPDEKFSYKKQKPSVRDHAASDPAQGKQKQNASSPRVK